MNLRRAFCALACSATILAALAAPALADPWRGGPHGDYHHHYGPRVVYVPAPRYYAPPPPRVVYAPTPPVYYAPPPRVVYVPPPVYYAPAEPSISFVFPLR